MAMTEIRNITPDSLQEPLDDISDLVEDFAGRVSPLEQVLYILTDSRTNARYCECHLRASTIVELSTIDVPLDPDEQAEYRANREIVEDHAAYERMKLDALSGRTFSNIVAEFNEEANTKAPLQIIGGQHRFNAIEDALESSVDEYHGIKVYFSLDSEQRLDVQLISNTNIAVSTDLLDRMYVDLTRSGGHPRVRRQSLREGSPHAKEYRVPLHRGIQGRGGSAGPLLSGEIHPPARLRARHLGSDPTQLDQASTDRPRRARGPFHRRA